MVIESWRKNRRKTETRKNPLISIWTKLTDPSQFQFDASTNYWLQYQLNLEYYIKNEYSIFELPFLDILIRKWRTELSTDLLQRYRYAPILVFQIVPSLPHKKKYSIRHWLGECAIVVDLQLRDTRLDELENRLRKQRYPSLRIANSNEIAKDTP